MITPRFSCSQNVASVVVSIYCPAVRSSEVEIHVDHTLLTVHINPYFLRLNFSDALLDDDQSSANYNASSGYLTVTLTKAVRGQEFKDLDLLAKLLAPRTQPSEPPSIEVINDDQNDLVERTENLSLDQREILEAAKNDWQLPQNVPEPLPPLHLCAEKPYGFLNSYTGYLKHVMYTENEVNELGLDAETCPSEERRKKRVAHENTKWDEEHYIADYVDDEYIQDLIRWKHPHVTDTTDFRYTEEENLVMLRLPRKEYLATPLQTHNIYLTLITLLFSYAYDARTTQLDPTSESAWTLSVLTPAFSALDPPPYGTLQGDPAIFPKSELVCTLIPSYRRSLAFPLYRSFALAEACRADVASFLSKGKRTIIRCLLEAKHILDHHEVYYIYSKIWVDDFCLWLQVNASEEVLKTLGKDVGSLVIDKDMIGWDLETLETAARLAQERDPDSDDESVQL